MFHWDFKVFVDVVEKIPRGHESSTWGAADCEGNVRAPHLLRGESRRVLLHSRILEVSNVSKCLEILALSRIYFLGAREYIFPPRIL